MPRPSNTVERRAQIVTGLLSAMAKNGYDGASIQRIAKEAGLTPGLVHYHFKNKVEILVALLDQIGENLRARYEQCAAQTRSARTRLFAFIDAHLNLTSDADQTVVACWVIIGSEAIRNPEIRTAYEKLMEEDLELLESLVRDTLREAGRSTRKARKIAEGLMSAIQGSYQLVFVSKSTPKGFASSIVKEMADGIILAT